jgi:hypothetical protein
MILRIAHPILRDYYIQAISDPGPLHRKVSDHFINLLDTNDQPISNEAAEIILEVVHHLTESKQISTKDIKVLAARLRPDETPTMRAYSSLLEAALQIQPSANAPTNAVENRVSRVFLSYLSEDRKEATRLRVSLEKHGIDVWQDNNRLIPGRRWKQEIRKAIKSGDFFIACFSENYAGRSRTYMREELQIAIEELHLRPTDRSWFIPVMLGPIEIPDIPISQIETLEDLHWVSLYDDWDRGVASLLRALGSE